MTSEVFTQTIEVTSTAIDVRNHVNNLAYLEWCLDAAEAHWEIKATPTMKQDYVWYVLRHNIEYRAAAYEGETLEVKTWVDSSQGVKSDRRYEIYRIKDQKLLVEAQTLWCMLDAKTLRPAKITKEIRTLFLK